jgi:alkylation response protein AidB-like acyl-CoA dehydrogenase
MDLSYTQGEEAFRMEVRAFLEARLPADIAAKVKSHKRLDREDFRRWHAIAYEQGWATPHWPVEYGGTGWSAVQHHIHDEECCAAGAPRIIPFGVRLVGPVIIHFGSDWQKQRFLKPMQSGEEFWCQGFSEPGSGSDLASLRTRAVRDGDHYVVNGQKTWTTLGHLADWIFCLVRTDAGAKQQEGISMLLIDMKTPGVERRPIITLDGEHHVNEVFFDDVRVPARHLVGEENKGWDYAKFLLVNERVGIAGVGQSKAELELLKEMARLERKRGRPLIEDPLFQAKLARLEIELMALEYTNMRMLSSGADSRSVGALSSFLKIKGSEIQQTIMELAMEAVGPYAAPWIPEARSAAWNGEPVGPAYAGIGTEGWLDRRKTTIYGGSNEIQKNIIAKRVLGL